MKKLIIFGTTEIGELASYYFDRYSEYKVVGYCVDKAYRTVDHFTDLPVYNYEDLKDIFPPKECSIFVAMAYNNFMKNRSAIYNKVKSDGYQTPTLIAPEAVIHTDQIGENTIIFENVTIQPSCSIGNNVLISPGVMISHHTTIADNVYIGPNVSLCGHNALENDVFVGALSIIAPNVTVKKNNFLGAGAKIFSDTQANSAYLEAQTRRVPQDIKSLKHILYS